MDSNSFSLFRALRGKAVQLLKDPDRLAGRLDSHRDSVSVNPMTETVPNVPQKRSAAPWVILAFWFAWIFFLAWLARGEFTKLRPKHERERQKSGRVEPL